MNLKRCLSTLAAGLVLATGMTMGSPTTVQTAEAVTFNPCACISTGKLSYYSNGWYYYQVPTGNATWHRCYRPDRPPLFSCPEYKWARRWVG